MDAFPRGEDVHRATAAEVLGKPADELTRDERDRAKAVNFGIIYGISSFGLSEQLGIERDEAQRYIDAYLAATRGCSEFIERTIAAAKSDGYVDDAVRPPPADPGAAGREPPGAHAGRAAGRQLRHPGLGRRHHQGRDDRAPTAGCATRACGPGWCCRSTTSCCSRCRRASWRRARRSSREEMDRRLPARPAARGRRRRRRQLAGSQVAPGGDASGTLLRFGSVVCLRTTVHAWKDDQPTDVHALECRARRRRSRCLDRGRRAS